MIFFFISLSTYLCYLILKTGKSLAILEHEKFSVVKSFQWILKNPKKVFLNFELLAFILIVIALNSEAKVMGICMIIFYIFMFLWMFNGYKKMPKFNSDMVRTGIITFILYILIIVGCMLVYNQSQQEFLIYDDRWLYYIIVILAMYFNCFIVLISALFNNVIRFVIGKFTSSKKKTIKRKQK